MTEEEKAVLRQIAETEKRIVHQQERIVRLKAESQPTDSAENLLEALRATHRARRAHLDALRKAVKAQDVSKRSD